MTKFERSVALIDCVGGAAITYAGYLASTGGDLILALALLTFGMLPIVVHFLTSEFKLGLMKTVLACIVWTVVYPALVLLAAYFVSLRWEQDAWFIQPVLHYGAIGLTVLMGTGFSIILLAVVAEEIVDASKGNHHISI